MLLKDLLLKILWRSYYVGYFFWVSLFHFQILILIHLLKKFDLTGIDLVQIRVPLVLNQTIPVPRSMGKGRIASSFWNYNIPDPDQIGSGDVCILSWHIEAGFTWSGTAEAIRDNQHIKNNEIFNSNKIIK